MLLFTKKCPNCSSTKIKVLHDYLTKNYGIRHLYKCKKCRRLFSETKGTFLEGLKKPISKVWQVIQSRTEGMESVDMVRSFLRFSVSHVHLNLKKMTATISSVGYTEVLVFKGAEDILWQFKHVGHLLGDDEILDIYCEERSFTSGDLMLLILGDQQLVSSPGGFENSTGRGMYPDITSGISSTFDIGSFLDRFWELNWGGNVPALDRQIKLIGFILPKYMEGGCVAYPKK